MSTEPTQITETDILRWLRNESAKAGIDGIEVHVTTRDYKPFSAHHKNSRCGIGDTVEAAIADVMQWVKTPAQVVDDLEEQLAAARRALGEVEAKKGVAA